MSTTRSDAAGAGPVAALARILGCTESQAWTLLVALPVATALSVAGFPAVQERVPLPALAVGAAPAAQGLESAPGQPPAEAPEPLLAGPVLPPEPLLFPPGSPGGVDFGGSGSGPEPGAPAPAPAPAASGPLFARVPAPAGPAALAMTSDGHVHVGTDNGTAAGDRQPAHLFSYTSTGHLTRSLVLERGSSSRTAGITALAVDEARGELLATDAGTNRLLAIDWRSGRVSTRAQVPDLRPCLGVGSGTACEPGIIDHAPRPSGVALAGDGSVLVSDAGQGTVWRIRRGSTTPEVWHQALDYATDDGPAGLSVDPASGDVHLVVGRSLDAAVAPHGEGALYRLATTGDGAAGTRTLVAPFANGARPNAVVVGALGTHYVSLGGANVVAVIAADGTRQQDVAAPEGFRFDHPSGLGLGEQELLVANRGTAATEAGDWVVLRIPVGDASM